MMRKHKISKKQFNEIFTRRTLTFRERYMQSFWFIQTSDVSYMVEQKLNPLGVLVTLILSILFALPILITGGIKDLSEYWKECYRHMNGKAIRKDYCYTDTKSTSELIKLAGW